MEEILALMWYKYRSRSKVARQMDITVGTLNSWLKALGLYICAGCSTYTGLLHLKTIKCPACTYYFCQECTDDKTDYHFNNAPGVTALRIDPTKKSKDVYIDFDSEQN
jgi:hypothetical protein|tara:strand:+ start:5977 stop:6300 length:324 start_codon:yes stop_codon:yes gene_type:complete